MMQKFLYERIYPVVLKLIIFLSALGAACREEHKHKWAYGDPTYRRRVLHHALDIVSGTK